MEKVRAKFHCLSKQKDENGNGTNISLMAVYSDDPNSENKQYWDLTPSGQINLQVLNDAATEKFEVGKEYYVDFIQAE